MQSLIGTCRQFIENFAIFVSIWYELLEVNFYEVSRKTDDVTVDEKPIDLPDEDAKWTRA
ncbi:hypothetical protein PC128_g6746 [Phytophthora cactorum]|nr:hypothetical protein PC128_g6746 [Phytophthora cactorum]